MRRFLQSILRISWGWLVMGLLLSAGQSQQPGGAQPAAPEAQPVSLIFPDEGERYWWTEAVNGSPQSAPTKITDKKVMIQPKAKSGWLWILDVKSGNSARFDLARMPNTIEFKSDTWTHVMRVRVEVKANDKPVAGAIVELKDKSGQPQSRVLEPTALGVVQFERVALGNLHIDARFDDGSRVSNEVSLKAERSEPSPVFKIGVSGNVPTVEVPAAVENDAQTQSSTASPPQERNMFSTIGVIVLFLLAVGMTIGVLILLVKLATKHEQPLSEAMAKMGVQLPQASTADPSAVNLSATAGTAIAEPIVPEGFCAFCGQKKDPSSGACACTIGSTPGVGVGTAVGTLTGTWRLVGLQGAYAGQVFEIRDDLVVIGREATNPVALTGDTAVSRRHAQLVKQGDTLFIQDLGSSNGTYVNGIPITAETILRPGDTVQFGSSIFKVEG